MRTSPKHLLALAVFSGASVVLQGQTLPDEDSGPPSFTPPPPPNFSPPSPPPAPPSSTQGSAQGNQQNQRNAQATPAEELQAVADYPSQGIVDPDDPRMQDVVGLIQIPDLGTNDVLSMLEEFTGKPVLRQQSLPAVKITFFSQDEMTRAEAIRAIESLLAINGIGITRVGDDFLKAVPAAIINTQVPLFWEGTTIGAVASQLIYEKVFELGFLTPAEAVPLIQPLMSQGAPLAMERSGLLLITDSLVNLQRIERVLDVIDGPSRVKTEILFFQLANADAQETVQRLQQIQSGPLSRRLENNTTFDADQNSNQLIVFTHPSNVELIEDLISKMDIDVAPVTATNVYSIRYAEAVEVVNIIDQVISGQKEVRDNREGGQTSARQAARQQQSNQAAAALRAEAGNLQFSDFLTLVADERANSIVASGTPGDLRVLNDLINQIDVLLAQVRIEAVIVEVSLSENDASGISSLGASYFENDDGPSLAVNPFTIGGISFGGAATSGDAASGGEDGGPAIYFGPNREFGIAGIIQAVKTHSRSEILSAPTIVTTHNREARISVGERRPLITGTTMSGTTGATSSQIQYQNIGIELTVTPLIGSDDVIQLEIEQSIEDVGEFVEIDNNEQPTIISRQASSFVSVGDGQLVVLGGLQRNNIRENRSKFPFLGSIPGLEKIFTRVTESEDRTEIILFLRPRIIRDAVEANEVSRNQIDVMESRERVEDYLDSGTFRRQEPLDVEIEEDDDQPDPSRRHPSRRTRP